MDEDARAEGNSRHMIYDSVKQWFLGVLAKEQKQPEPIITLREEERQNAPATSPNRCPQCGSNLFVEVTGTVKRCQQCGHQGTVPARPASVPPTFTKRTGMPSQCPACHSSLLTQIGDGWRCGACGHQPQMALPQGIARSQLETFEYPSAEHQRKFAQGFNSALWRIVGPRR